ncbi:MAG: transposase [Rhodospirillaceae bacterium]|nr:transposase [Rhodospirillaceae bacterium]
MLAHIRARFAASNGTYGSPRMHVDLCEDGLSIGRHRTARLMRDNDLKATQKRRNKNEDGQQSRWADYRHRPRPLLSAHSPGRASLAQGQTLAGP